MKPGSEFSVLWKRPNRLNRSYRSKGLRTYCKSCVVQGTLEYRKSHPEVLAAHLACSKAWRLAHLERHAAGGKQWRKKHPEKLREYARKHRSTVAGKLNTSMNNGLYKSLRGNKAGRRWETLVGYTLQELKAHLESLFEQGMTWELFWRGDIHIDHIFPLARLIFNHAEDPTFKYAWSLGNLQPLWREDNQAKGDQVPWEFKPTMRAA